MAAAPGCASDSPERPILARRLGTGRTTNSFSRDANAERGSASESVKQLKRDAKAERGNDPERKDLKIKKKGDG